MPNNNHDSKQHPELEFLLSRRDGLLPADEAAAVDEHLADCTLCRLALKQAARFEDLDQDDETAAEADWAEAEARLENPWPKRRRPAAVNPWRDRSRWLVPLAAAAVLALVVVNVGQREIHQPFGDAVDSMRGGPVAAPVIEAVFPHGELDTIPAHFQWQTERDFESYDLELFTEDLVAILTLEGVPGLQADIPDSVLAVLKPGQTYFWHVKDGAGLAAQEASATIWFRVGSEK